MAMNMDAMLRIKADVQGENNIRRLGNSLQGLQGQTKNAMMGFNSLKGAVAGFGAAIAGSAIVAGLTSVVKKSIDAGDELFNLQAKTGVAANALIGIGNAAKLADVDMGTLGKGLNRLNVNLVKAAEGNDELAARFQALGIKIRDTNGQVIPADKALKQIADRFADMPDGAQKAAAAVQLFGKSGADLIPLLNEGADSMDKFSYRVGEDFAARSDLFNDTVTELGIKTQGFGMELTDALLPALQSILEVFGDLFNTEQDWTALFEVIKGGVRTLATVIYATIKLVDQLVKAAFYGFDAISKALRGDFSGAGQALAAGVGAGLQQAREDFNQIGKIWTDAPSPGTGRRTRGRSMMLSSGGGGGGASGRSAADRAAATAAREAARDAEQAQERYNDALVDATNLAKELQNKTRDVKLETVALGAVGKEAIELQYKTALNEANDEADGLAAKVAELIKATGGTLRFEGLQGLAKEYLAARENQINVDRTEKLAKLDQEQQDAMNQLRRDASILTRDQERQLTINERLLQIQKEMPDLYAAQKDEIDALVEKTAGLTEAQERNKSIVESIAQSIGDAVGSSLTMVIDGTKDWANSLREIAADLLRNIAQQLLQIMVIQPLVKGITGAFGFAGGGIMTGDGPVPLKAYARGGIANSPQLAMFGEGSTPEAFVPLPDGRRIPVAIKGGGGGTTVNVSVDAKGTNVQGNAGQGAALGRVIAQAVQAELVRQKRPGGLLVAA